MFIAYSWQGIDKIRIDKEKVPLKNYEDSALHLSNDFLYNRNFLKGVLQDT